MLSAINPRMWLAALLAMLLSFASGYGYKAYRVSLADAAKNATQDTAQTVTKATVQTTDKAAITRLTAQIEAARAHAATLEQIINEASHANPAAADCRLPDGLRTAINADLAPGSQ